MGEMIFMGVGPGDPELLTLKAVRTLEKADLFALPDSGAKESAVEKIVGQWIKGKRILRLQMPMRGTAADWEKAHEKASRLLMDMLDEGMSVVYPVLGDPSIYASSGYLLKRIKENHSCEVIPGIPAMCAAAARMQMPLCEGREELCIMPGELPDGALPSGNFVVMKAGRKLAVLRERLLKERREGFVVQNLGMDNERIMRIEESMAHEHDDYFTTILIKHD